MKLCPQEASCVIVPHFIHISSSTDSSCSSGALALWNGAEHFTVRSYTWYCCCIFLLLIQSILFGDKIPLPRPIPEFLKDWPRLARPGVESHEQEKSLGCLCTFLWGPCGQQVDSETQRPFNRKHTDKTTLFSCYWPGFNSAHPDVIQWRLFSKCYC